MDMKKIHIKKSESKGITLIALIVTIIVLIILASITISTLTGNNSVYAKLKMIQIIIEN